MKVDDVAEVLKSWGVRLRAARIDRNDTMDVFAERLGVSTGTVRAMERGAPTVQIGVWLNALWLLNQLDPMTRILERSPSVLDRIDAEAQRKRQRASRRSR